MNADGSNKQQASKLNADINMYGISANGKMIWIGQDVAGENVNGKDKYKDLPKTSGHVFDDLMMRHWDQWSDGSNSHILIAPLENNMLTATPVDILKGEPFDSPLKPDGGDEEIAWSPDGKFIAYTCKKLKGKEYAVSTNSEIYLYDVATGKTSNLSEGNQGYDKVPAFSPDGSKLAWMSWDEPANEASLQRLFVIDLKTKQKSNLTNGFEYNVEGPQWSDKGDRIYFLADINATNQLFYCAADNKDKNGIKQLTNDIADITGFSLVTLPSKEDKIICSQMSLSSPTEIFSININDGKTTQISFTNKEDLSPVTMGEVKKFMVKTSDGKDMLTWVVYPPNFNPANRYPTLLFCQGGPQSTVSQFFSYRWNLQLMAANGYIVVAPNRRGLPGFGKQWNDQISNDWGGQAMSDLLSAIDSISKHPYVNKEKLGAVGASFGGYSVFLAGGTSSTQVQSIYKSLRSSAATTRPDHSDAIRTGAPSRPWRFDTPSRHPIDQTCIVAAVRPCQLAHRIRLDVGLENNRGVANSPVGVAVGQLLHGLLLSERWFEVHLDDGLGESGGVAGRAALGARAHGWGWRQRSDGFAAMTRLPRRRGPAQ